MVASTPTLATSLERAVAAVHPWSPPGDAGGNPGPGRQHAATVARLVLLLATVTVLVQVLGCSANRHLRPHPGAVQRGLASWYGPGFHGRLTANGEVYDMHGLSAAHRSLPLGTVVEVTNLDNGRRVRLRINDRGPFIGNRVLDLSQGAAERLDMLAAGLATVEIRVISIGDNAYRAQASLAPASATAAAVTEADAFSVQVGAFRDAVFAQRLSSRLARDFRDVRVVDADGWLRVQIGRFTDRLAAERLLARLRRHGENGVIVPVLD